MKGEDSIRILKSPALFLSCRVILLERSMICDLFLQCSVDCGTGHMSRVVRCNDAQGNVVDDEKCTADIKPAVTKQCYKDGDHCQLLWQYTPWSEVGPDCSIR